MGPWKSPCDWGVVCESPNGRSPPKMRGTLFIYLPVTFTIALKYFSSKTTDIQPTPFHGFSWFKSSQEEAPVYRAVLLCAVCSLSLSGLSGLHWRLGSNLPARGCVSCVGAVAQSICLHQWTGSAVGLGQQDPAKHQLLAAFYTDSHQVGHIYSTASSPVRLEDLSALSAWIFLFSLVVFVLSARLSTPSTACALCAYLSISVWPHLSHFRVYRFTRVHKGCAHQFVVGPWHWKKAFDSLRWMDYIVVGLMMLFIYLDCQRFLLKSLSVRFASTNRKFRTIYWYKIIVFSVVIPTIITVAMALLYDREAHTSLFSHPLSAYGVLCLLSVHSTSIHLSMSSHTFTIIM